jgi:hypothetical protein
MMKIINKSRKIIGINGEPFLPGKVMVLADGMEENPCIADYLAKGIIANADAGAADAEAVSEAEKAKIEEEAVERYKAQQAGHDAEVAAVKSMKKKDDLLTKAAGMGIEVGDNDTIEDVRGKILEALG